MGEDPKDENLIRTMLGKFINHKEDSLTAAVFTHLLHLPHEVFWRILRDSCYSDKLPETVGEPLAVEFLPSWGAAGTRNKNRVIPDLFLRFAAFDLIVEAKRWDDNMQDPGQWTAELAGYLNEYGSDGKPVRMLALGGLHRQADDEVSIEDVVCPVHKCHWRGLLERARRMLRELDHLSFPSSSDKANARILTDLIDMFSWHGFSVGTWFADCHFRALRLSVECQNHHRIFQERIQQIHAA